MDAEGFEPSLVEWRQERHEPNLLGMSSLHTLGWGVFGIWTYQNKPPQQASAPRVGSQREMCPKFSHHAAETS